MRHNFDEIIDRRGTNSSKWLKYPPDVLPMWVADSDFRCPQPVVDAVTRFAQFGVYGYPYVDEGSFEASTVSWMQRRFGWELNPDQIDFVSSLGTALALAVKAFTVPGDQVLLQTPLYPPFTLATQWNDRVPLNSSLIWQNGRYEIDFADFEQKAAHPKTRLFMLCNPHNPTGRVFSQQELERMGDICLKHGVMIFSDEIHADYIFDKGRHIPFSMVADRFQPISLVGTNPSKTFNIAGLRTAAVISPHPEPRARFKKELQAAKLGRNPFGILAYTTAYDQCAYYADQVREYIEANVEHAVAFINNEVRGIRTYKPEATFLLWLDCRDLGMPQPELERFFVEKAKVGLNSGTSFGVEGEGFMRLNLACPRATLNEGLCRIKEALN